MCNSFLPLRGTKATAKLCPSYLPPLRDTSLHLPLPVPGMKAEEKYNACPEGVLRGAKELYSVCHSFQSFPINQAFAGLAHFFQDIRTRFQDYR